MTREIKIKHYRAGTVVREIIFTGRCLYYTEKYDNRGNLYFEVVIQDAFYNNTNEKAFRYKDFYAVVTLDRGSLRNLSGSNTFWSGTGLVLGGVATIEAGVAIATGAITIAITFIFGTNTICTAVWDLYMDYEDTDNKIGAFNFLRDNIFKDEFNLLGQLGGKLGNISIYSKFNPKKIKLWKMGKYSNTMQMTIRQLDYTRYGYDVYQMVDGTKNMNDYAIGLYESLKK